MRIFLEEIGNEREGWECVTALGEVVERLETRQVEALAVKAGVGCSITVLLWLLDRLREDSTFPIPEIQIHSGDQEARDRLMEVLHEIEKFRPAED